MAAKIELRDFEPRDEPAVHGWSNDKRVIADLGGRRKAFAEDDARGWVARAMDRSRDRKWAFLLDGGIEPVGFVALFGLERDIGPELAVVVGDPAAWGKGVAREAERQACVHAFDEHGTHRIHAEIPATNRAAQKVVTHLGFKREGTMRRAIRRGDEAVDNEVWGLLPEEFTGWEDGRS